MLLTQNREQDVNEVRGGSWLVHLLKETVKVYILYNTLEERKGGRLREVVATGVWIVTLKPQR